jgi:hypothetical protein
VTTFVNRKLFVSELLALVWRVLRQANLLLRRPATQASNSTTGWFIAPGYLQRRLYGLHTDGRLLSEMV